MKTIHYLSIIILSFSSQILLAQNDTLVGVLRDISDKIIKRYPVTLGSQNPITVKTNKHGVFTIPGANLNDTLFVTIKKTRNIVKVPVNGYNYITITLENSTFNAKRSFEPDEALKEIMERERNKIVSSSVMTYGFHTHGSRITCQHLRTKAVDHGLYQHHTDGHGRLLQDRRKCNACHSTKFRHTENMFPAAARPCGQRSIWSF